MTDIQTAIARLREARANSTIPPNAERDPTHYTRAAGDVGTNHNWNWIQGMEWYGGEESHYAPDPGYISLPDAQFITLAANVWEAMIAVIEMANQLPQAWRESDLDNALESLAKVVEGEKK